MAEPDEQGRLVGEGFLRGAYAAPSRTLIDILEETAARHPDAPAVDDGHATLTYTALVEAVDARARVLERAGVRPGDRVGVRIPSGTDELYVAILAVLRAGAAYVPVDVDDPPERAAMVFAEAEVVAVLVEDGGIELRRPTLRAGGSAGRPLPEDDAWVIFTSGSTGTPKGVAVSHRSAAALVDAESRLFLTDAPIAPGDRVLAGLSVAFDASCEEMWLAWAHGACLVPAPRALVRSGMDLGPWLVAREITVISTVPTLAGLWRPEELAGVRLLIFGGEACPAELAGRLAVPGREVWNTYGPTETTVVACAALMSGDGPVRIGHALDGWDLAVLDDTGARVAPGEVGELVIGGVGLARYLDEVRDREKFAPVESLGWDRAYRSGDLVRYETAGLVFVGRGDDQVKLGGRRIELGEVDAALQQLAGVAGAAAAVRRTAGGSQVLVGYVVPREGVVVDVAAARRDLLQRLPAPLVPLVAVVDALPTRGSGKVDREALPWPLERFDEAATEATEVLSGTSAWLAEQWTRVLGTAVTGPDDDFFASGGGSLVAAQLVAALREQFPTVTVADVYENPRVEDLAQRLDELAPAVVREGRVVSPVPRAAQVVQTLLSVPLSAVSGLRWSTWVAALGNVVHATGRMPWVPTVSWWWVVAGWVLLITPVGRMLSTVLVARLLLRDVRPGTYPRGGSVHLRLWFVESFATVAGAANLAGAPWVTYYARALGATIGQDVDLHSLPPLTGMLTLGAEASIEPEVDLSGHWVDGDVLHVGRVRVGARATVGTRSILAPGARVGQGSEVAPGSAVLEHIPPGEKWGGSPAVLIGPAPRDWPLERAPRASHWVAVYGATAVLLAGLPLVAGAAGLLVLWPAVRDSVSAASAARAALGWVPLATVTALAVLALLTVVCVRLLGIGVRPGHHPVRSRVGWQVWATLRLMDEARTALFPLYSSLMTPVWLRLLGARVGRDVEASTVLLLPGMTTVGDGAFLADDTLVGSYELGRGWLRIEPAKVGKRAFLGNSGMTAPGRKVPKRGLVAVLSATPERAKAGTSWLGSPPVRLRRSVVVSDAAGTFAPPRRVRLARALVEAFRVVPVIVTVLIALGVAVVLEVVIADHGALVLVAAPLSILAAGAVAALIASAAKWLLVGRVTAGEHPLWSTFVWRNELADTFVELVAVPWFVLPSYGTPALNLWLRSLGARVGAGVWCETYWLPEADLVSLGDAVTVNRGCVLQTHLFHDRVMSLDTVVLEDGASIGPHGVVLPAASVGVGASVGASSLVLRGDAIPGGTRWRGNPISPAGDTARGS